MMRAALLCGFVTSMTLLAQELPPRASTSSPRNASYTIDARLDPATRTITATEIIEWRNITSTPATELQFHLYWNAWKNTRSTFFREIALTVPAQLAPDDAATMEISSIAVVGGADLTGQRRFIAPDDGNRDDETVMAVALPQPVAPGGSIAVEVKWTARVPGPIARTGKVGTFYFIAQWFPKLGVFENAGWNCHQFHAATEFFSDYGVYDVRLTVPRGWTVGATGVERDRTDATGDAVTHHYRAADVHDFAWTTSPDYLERRARFDHPGLPPVDMRLLLRPEHEGQADRHFAATRSTLRQFGEWFGAYPYGHLTIVDPAFQSEADGMEYPMLITAGTRWLAARQITVNTPEEVTIHEAGHQWWYGIVGTNEFEHAWMDEGLTTYTAARALAEDYPDTYLEHRYFGGFVPWVFKDLPVTRDTYWNRLAGYRTNAESDDPSMASFRYHPGTGPYITYHKSAMWLATLERYLGWPVMQRALAAYFERWQFRHPRPRDFFDVVTEVSGRDLEWFFDQVYRSSNVFDYGVESLQSTVSGGGFLTTVMVRRFGEAFFPVDVVVTFEDGTQATSHWDGRDRWKLVTYEGASRASSAAVDPGRVLLLDVNYTNNSRTLNAKSAAAATKWSLKWMVWLQDALLTWSFLV